jgi:hypothetical protein
LAPPWTNVYFELQMNIYFRYHGKNETKTWGVLKLKHLNFCGGKISLDNVPLEINTL